MSEPAPDSSAPAAPEEIHLAWRAFVAAYRVASRETAKALAAECGIPPNHFGVLAALELYSDGAMRLSDVLPHVAPLSQPALSRIVQAMERSGLIARRTDPDDRRVSIIRLTPAGRKAFERARLVDRRAVEKSFGRFLTADEARVLAAVLSRVAASDSEAKPKPISFESS